MTFVTFASDTRINWEDNNKLYLPLNLSVSKLVNENTVMAVGFATLIVNDYDVLDRRIEFRKHLLVNP